MENRKRGFENFWKTQASVRRKSLTRSEGFFDKNENFHFSSSNCDQRIRIFLETPARVRNNLTSCVSYSAPRKTNAPAKFRSFFKNICLPRFRPNGFRRRKEDKLRGKGRCCHFRQRDGTKAKRIKWFGKRRHSCRCPFAKKNDLYSK